MNFPDRNGYVEFYKNITQNNSEKAKEIARYNYKRAVTNFHTIEELLECNPDDKRLCNLDTVIIFLCLRFHLQSCQSLNKIIVNFPIEIIRYFDKGCERFIQTCQRKLKNNPYIQSYIYSLIVKMLIVSGKSDLNSITIEDILNLDNDNFHKNMKIRKQFIQNIENIYGIYFGKALPIPINVREKRKTDLEKFGTDHKIILDRIKEYLGKEYEIKGYQTKNPIESLKKFFNWLYHNYNDCSDVNLIKKEYWLAYRKYIMESELSLQTKRFRINDMIKFFNWIQEKKYIEEQITEFKENSGISEADVENNSKPRMHKSREHHKIILANILAYTPKGEKQFLLKCLILIASATGLRLNEILWLGPDCISDIKGDVGEIILQINEKQNIRNKPTSILPWGIEAIRILEQRLKKLPYMVFYFEKTNCYYQSLFQYKGKIFSINIANRDFNKILKELEIDYNIDFESGALYHALRHQKFNDIYDVTGGSSISVKIDSGHDRLKSIKIYTKQTMGKKEKEALKFMEDGLIVGKQAEILRDLLNSPFPPEKYMEVVKQMNLSNNITKDGLKRAMKYLGFGYCSAKKCLLAPICEECNFFWTCKTFEDELMERYAINFLLVKSRFEEIVDDNDDNDISLVSGLKYQEKWLQEIGVSDEQIHSLRVKYLEVK